MAEARQMNAHLVRAPGEDLDFEQRNPSEPAEHPIAAERGADTRAGAAAGGHARAAQPVAADRRGNLAVLGGHGSMDQREIMLLNGSPGKLRGEFAVSKIVIRNQQYAGSGAVKAMDDPRP